MSGGHSPDGLASENELMRQMERWIMRPTSLERDPELHPILTKSFSGSPTLSAVEQIEIYRQQYWLRHTASLKEDFPGVFFVLGERTFEEISRAYLSRSATSSFALRDLGRALPAYLEQQLLEGRLDASPGHVGVEMARLEWAYLDVFDAPDEPELDAGRALALRPEDWQLATFRVSGALRLLELDFPVADLRRSIKRGEADAGALPDAFAERTHWVVYRRDLRLWDKQVSEPAFRLLQQLAQGTPLVPSCEKVAASVPGAEARLERELMTWFALWGRLGWIRDVFAAGDSGPSR